MSTRTRQTLFSLVELLIVIAILGVLMSLLAPSLKSVMRTAYKTECQVNLKKFGTIFNLYAMDYMDLYPYNPAEGRGSRGFQQLGNNLVNQILWPYLFTRDINRTAFSEPYVHSAGEKEFEKLFLCPLADDEEIWPYIVGWGGGHSRRVPRYATRTYPYQFFFNFLAEGQGANDDPQMEKMGDRWKLNWHYTVRYSRGPQEGIDAAYNILASDVMLNFRTAPYGRGHWGNNTIFTNHVPVGGVGRYDPVHQNGIIGYKMDYPQFYEYDASYLLDNGGVVNYNEIPHVPNSRSDFVNWTPNNVIAPTELGR